MATQNLPQPRVLSQLSPNEQQTRIICRYDNTVMCNAADAKPRAGETVTLVTRPQPYGLTFYVTYFVTAAGQRGFVIEREA